MDVVETHLQKLQSVLPKKCCVEFYFWEML